MKLEVQERDGRGSSDSRRLRKQGMVPGVLIAATVLALNAASDLVRARRRG